MNKTIIVFLLLLFIIGCFLYTVLYATLNILPPDNPINSRIRTVLLTRKLFRTIFKLHQIGDARYAYGLATEYPRLGITVYYEGESGLLPDTMDKVVSEMNTVISKPRGIFVSHPVEIQPLTDPATDSVLAELAKTYPSDFSSGIARLSIIVLRSYAEVPTYAGIVRDDSHIFLFMDAIRGVADRQKSTGTTEVSTILHEFAHLLGADHLQTEGCILSDTVENTGYFDTPSTISQTFCEEDKILIREALE